MLDVDAQTRNDGINLPSGGMGVRRNEKGWSFLNHRDTESTEAGGRGRFGGFGGFRIPDRTPSRSTSPSDLSVLCVSVVHLKPLVGVHRRDAETPDLRASFETHDRSEPQRRR